MTPGAEAGLSWEFLPNHPREFFGLDEDFTQKDLKRAYNRLIRRFKPERAPDEFKKIRAAYEALDNQLRYVGSAPAHTTFYETEGAGMAIQAELEQQGPKEIFERLRAKPYKSAEQYYQLAILSDTVKQEEGASASSSGTFVGWILEGLAQHCSNPALLHLLYVYCHGSVEAAEAPALLVSLRQVLPDDEFAYVSEKLWFKLLTDGPFSTFRRLFESCIATMAEAGSDTRATLTLRLLRPALFVADQDWIERQWSFVEEHLELLPPWTEPDVDMFELLLDYHKQRSVFSEGPGARQQIDEALKGICHPDEPIADRAFLEWQITAAENGEGLLEAFPLDFQDYSPAFLPLSMYGEEVRGRVGQAEMPELEIRPRTLVREYLNRVEKLTDQSTPGRLWIVAVWSMLLLVAVLLVAATYWLGELAFHLYPTKWLRIVVLVLFGLAALVFTWKVAWRRCTVWVSFYFAKACHRQIWRPELMRLIRDTHLSTETILECMGEIKSSNLTNKDWIFNCVSEDWGLTFHSLAQSRS